MLTTPELMYLHRYFSGVANSIAIRMRDGSTPSEGSLTFLLCELLDESFTARHVLEYSLEELKKDLASCGVGTTIEISFQTNEHNQRFEGDVSFADLGIVFENRHPLHRPVRKAVLVQSKRLYPDSKKDFSLESHYNEFNAAQFANLQALAEKTGASNGMYYFLYNPDLKGFEATNRPLISAYEASSPRGLIPTSTREAILLHKVGIPLEQISIPGRGLFNDKAAIDRARDFQSATFAQLPGLRVCGLNSIDDITGPSSRLPIKSIYEHRLISWGFQFDADCLFETFADFMVWGLISCLAGSDHPDLLAIAEGIRPGEVISPGETPRGVAARHTLRVKVSSTLPDQTRP